MDNQAYEKLAETIERYWLGEPRTLETRSRAFMEYLQLVYTPEEAIVAGCLSPPRQAVVSTFDPDILMSARQVATACGLNSRDAKQHLDSAAAKGGVICMDSMLPSLDRAVRNMIRGEGLWNTAKKMTSIAGTLTKETTISLLGKGNGGLPASLYFFPPIPNLVNLHHFYPEIREADIKAAEIYQEFFIQDGLYKYYEGSPDKTPLTKVIPVQRTIDAGQKVLKVEEAHSVIDATGDLLLLPCPCRTRTEKLGIRECADRNPVGTCIMTGFSALNFESRNLGKRVTAKEAKAYLDEMQDMGLVAITDNHNNPVHGVICLCCGCCCSVMRGRTRWENSVPVAPSNFVPQIDSEKCRLCAKCVKRCMFDVLALDKKEKCITVENSSCIGCGVCTLACEHGAVKLMRLDRSESFSSAEELFNRVEHENRTS